MPFCNALAEFGYDASLVADMAGCFWVLGDSATAIQLMVAVTEDGAATAEDFARLGAMHISIREAGKARVALEHALPRCPVDRSDPALR